MLRSLTAQALRHRRGQAALLVLLSALITGVAVIGPLYQRAVDAVVVGSALRDAPVSASGISMHELSHLGTTNANAVLPKAIRPFFEPATQGSDALVGLVTGQGTTDVRIASRAGLCAHLSFIAGSCPATVQDVAVSALTARADGLHAGSTIQVSITANAIGQHASVPLHVSGIYAEYDPHSAYWFDHPYVGDGHSARQPDAIFAGDGLLPAVVRPIVNANGADVPIDSFSDVALRTGRVGAAQAPVLADGVQTLLAAFEDKTARADTSLDALLTGVAADQHQVHQVVPLFAGELVLLALALLLFVVSAAATQRRPEVALARLRGQRRTTATAPMMAELACAVVVGVPLGLLAALAGIAVAGHAWLSATAGVALPRSAVLALAAALFAQLVVIIAVARRLAREPVVTLLRRVPVRHSAVRLGQVEVGVAVLALAASVTVVTSGLSGPVALLAPGLLALSIGLLLGAAVPVVAGRIGKRALAAGRVRTALAALQLARRPGARGVLVVLVVASSVLVAAADTWQVAAANRTARAELEVGAPAVLDTGASTAAALEAATAKVDPTGRALVPVVVITPPTLGVVTLATHPAQAAALARWGWPHAAPGPATLARLDPRLPAPIILTGGWVEVHLGAVAVQGGELPDLDLDVVSVDGTPASYDLGTLPRRSGSVVLRQSVPCQEGCRWQGLSVVRALTDSASQYAQVDVAGVTMAPSKPLSGNAVGAKSVALGSASTWRSATPAGSPQAVLGLTTGLTRKPVVDSNRLPPNTLLVVQDRGGPGFRLRFFDAGVPVSVLHGDVPVSIPALTTVASHGRTPLTTFDAARLDGGTHLFTSVGNVSTMPGVPSNAALADIDILARLADRPVNFASYQVWLADPSPANVARRSAALARLGVPVFGVRTIQARESALRDAGAPQSLRLGLISGAVGLLIALGVLIITTVTTLRSRRYDVAALGLSGVPPSLARAALVGEGIALSVIGTVVGAACGVLGGRLLLRAAPFLTGGSAFPAERTFTAWWVVVAVLLGTLALLVGLSGLIAVTVVRRARPGLVREDS